MKKILFLVSEDSYFCSHRLNLGRAAQNVGYEVAVATKITKFQKKFRMPVLLYFRLNILHEPV